MAKLCDEIYREARLQLVLERCGPTVDGQDAFEVVQIDPIELDRRVVRLLCEKVELLVEIAMSGEEPQTKLRSPKGT